VTIGAISSRSYPSLSPIVSPSATTTQSHPGHRVAGSGEPPSGSFATVEAEYEAFEDWSLRLRETKAIGVRRNDAVASMVWTVPLDGGRSFVVEPAFSSTTRWHARRLRWQQAASCSVGVAWSLEAWELTVAETLVRNLAPNSSRIAPSIDVVVEYHAHLVTPSIAVSSYNSIAGSAGVGVAAALTYRLR
jgi:hypothetical protein